MKKMQTRQGQLAIERIQRVYRGHRGREEWERRLVDKYWTASCTLAAIIRRALLSAGKQRLARVVQRVFRGHRYRAAFRVHLPRLRKLLDARRWQKKKESAAPILQCAMRCRIARKALRQLQRALAEAKEAAELARREAYAAFLLSVTFRIVPEAFYICLTLKGSTSTRVPWPHQPQRRAGRQSQARQRAGADCLLPKARTRAGCTSKPHGRGRSSE
jgi:hypothetical protein